MLCVFFLCFLFEFGSWLNFPLIFNWFLPPPCPFLNHVIVVPKPGKEEVVTHVSLSLP